MILRNVYDVDRGGRNITLYELFLERDETINISGERPSYEDHCKYVDRIGIAIWWDFIIVDDEIVGTVSCTKDKNELGVFIFKEYQGKGYGSAAVKAMMEKVAQHREVLRSIDMPNIAGRGNFIARINAKNKKSQSMFEGLGFVPKHITYELPA